MRTTTHVLLNPVTRWGLRVDVHVRLRGPTPTLSNAEGQLRHSKGSAANCFCGVRMCRVVSRSRPSHRDPVPVTPLAAALIPRGSLTPDGAILMRHCHRHAPKACSRSSGSPGSIDHPTAASVFRIPAPLPDALRMVFLSKSQARVRLERDAVGTGTAAGAAAATLRLPPLRPPVAATAG